MAGLSAPSNRSAVALLNAAKPSIGRYCTIKYAIRLRNKKENMSAYNQVQII
jgi:hypothetical protein